VVDVADNGRDGHHLGASEAFDAVILDLGLPVLDGISVLKRWREAGRTMPVVILTARDSWHEKVAGIDAGADDCLAKPFHDRDSNTIEVFVARLRRKLPPETIETVRGLGRRLAASP
jgi:two-component system OmpR family response regulator